MTDTITYLGLLDDAEIALDVAALEIAALDHPDVDLEPCAELLNAIVARLAELEDDASTDMARADLLGQVIAGEYGFLGDRDTYDDPANADLIRVLQRRRGLPVTLSILYVAAARRLGWPADALNTPSHVLVRIGTDVSPILIDPFSGGGRVSPDQVAALMSQQPRVSTQPPGSPVSAMTNRETLVRVLTNQASRAELAGKRARALTLYERMTVIAPAHGHAWWERARLELVAGNVSEARASLSAMLEMTRDPERRRQITEALTTLANYEA